jgi:hypothetical protein
VLFCGSDNDSASSVSPFTLLTLLASLLDGPAFHEPRYPGLITSMSILSTILNLILWIWIIQVAAGVLMYGVALGKSFGQHGPLGPPCIETQLVDVGSSLRLPRGTLEGRRESAGRADAATSAFIDRVTQNVMQQIRWKCVAIASVVNEHGEDCQELAEHPDERLGTLLDRNP